MSTPRPKPPPAPRSRITAQPKSKSPKWKDAVAGRADDDFVPYAIATTFSQGDLVSHPKFGKGMVLTIDGEKMFVLFEDGIKKLIHATK